MMNALTVKSGLDYSKKRNSNLDYDAFFKSSPIPMWTYCTSSLKFLDVNPAAIEKYGYSREEFLSMTIKDIRPDKEVKRFEKFIHENQSDPRVSSYWQHKKKDGTIIYVDVYSHKINLQDGKNRRQVTAFDVTKRKTAEDELTKSEQRFRDLAELLPQIIFEIDLNGQLLYCNKIAYDTFQYPYDTDLTTINIFDFVSLSQIENAQENLTKMLLGGKLEKIEYDLLKRDGSSFSAIALISPILQNQVPIGFRGTIMDVSEMKHVHKELHYSQMKYSSLFENAYSIMMILDPENRKFVDANNAAAQFYGYSIEQLKQMLLDDITATGEEEIKASLNAAMTLKTNQFIRLHKLSDGSKKFVEVFTSPILINGKTYIFSVIHDINDRILTEANIKILNKAIEQSPVSVVITSGDGNIEYVNPKFCEVTGYSPAEIMGKNPRILKSGEQSEDYYKVLWQTITAGKTWYGEFRNKKKDGSNYWESASISPLFDEHGNVTHFVAIKEDITERKIKEDELRQAKELAEESNRLKSSFLANMSHELRTPLVGILGYADILSNELKEDEYREMANTILQSGQQLIETLNSLLDLSRIESNHNNLKINTNELKAILNESYSLFHSVAKNKNLFMKLSLPSENIFIDTDTHLLNKVFNNLMNNALKFTSKGGITINAAFVLEKNEQFVKIDIIDTGIGIPEEFQELIFEPFRQASEGLSRAYGGTGLGLTITKKIVEILNGTISVTSKEGVGSTFTVKLPLSKTAHPSISESQDLAEVKELKLEHRPSLLLVEDDITNAHIVIAYLNPYFNIDHVLDGQAGINICKTKSYDTILMDIALKGIDGTNAMREIRKLNEHYLNLPIIAVTAFAMLGDKESFLRAGFSHYISKPFTRAELFEILSKIFRVGSD